MLLRFRVANYASIRDELELSMTAINDHSDLAIRYVKQVGVSVLPVAAIYGANASGKSNVVDSFVFMRAAVLRSHQNWRPGAPIDRRPFKLDSEMKSHPTIFTVDFLVDQMHYEYGFSLNDSRILSEWLYSFPKKRPRLFFERSEGSPIKFGPSLKGLRQNMEKLMRPNSLYLSTAAANNHPQLTKIYDWFSYGILPVKASTDLAGGYTAHEWLYHDREDLRDLLTYADTGVIDLEVEQEEVSTNAAEKFQEFIKAYAPEDADSAELGPSLRVEFVHRGAKGSARLLMDEESSGTLAWVFSLVRLMLLYDGAG